MYLVIVCVCVCVSICVHVPVLKSLGHVQLCDSGGL